MADIDQKAYDGPVRALIFDKDGTLHDTEKVFRLAWREAAVRFGVPDIETTADHCTGLTIEGIRQYWEAKYPDIPFDPYIELRNRFFARKVAESVPVREGAMELLRALRERGYKLALATSTERVTALDHMRRTGMDIFFDAMIFGDAVEHGKPSPDIYLAAADALGISPGACVGVEDSVNGIMAIVHAGMRAIMVPDLMMPTPELEARLWARCDRLTDILSVLDRPGKTE